MPTVEIMKREFSQFKDTVLGLFTRLLELAVEIGAEKPKDVAAGLVKNINAPFLFVVVGEVKSGKSSFINALLGDEICRVDPAPCTDNIEKIVYSPEPYEKKLAPNVKELGRPSEILKDIAIVDTPGTNSIIDQHQEITERFIPESDLVIFVFPALNPYSKTAWEFFQYVHKEWHKKIIFVLQQADRASAEELRVNTEKVVEYARNNYMDTPNIFHTSAALGPEDPKSGLAEVWQYIQDTVTGGRHYLLKMESLLGTAAQVREMAVQEINTQFQALAEDKKEGDRITSSLAQAKERSLKEMETLKKRLVEAYGMVSMDIVQEFDSGLSLPNLVKNTIKGVFGRKNAFKEWVESLNTAFNERFSARADSIARDAGELMIDSIARLMEQLVSELKESRHVVSPGLPVSAIAKQRMDVIDEAIANLFELLNEESLSRRMRPQGLRKIGDQAVVGGVMTTVGAIIAASAHAVIFDVTGGVFATVGALLAVNTLFFKRGSVIRGFKDGFREGRERLEKELGEKLAARIQELYAELDKVFDPFFANIAQREEHLERLQTMGDALARDLAAEADRIRELA